MTHTARKRSESAFYHVVTKGSGGQIIFEDERDRARYLDILCDAVDAFGIEVHAYCLMSNHVHLLIRDRENELSAFMKRLNERYAMYFAKKASRVGSVFQTPFWSEAVEDDSYYLSALRYIHANPEPAGICAAADYVWSSYRAYLGEPSFVTTELALELLGGVGKFAGFSTHGGRYALPFPRSKLQRHLSPDECWRVACEIVGKDVLSSMRQMKQRDRLPHIERLLAAGFTEREICRLTGLGKNTVHRVHRIQ